MLWCVRLVNVMMSNEWLSQKNSEGKKVTHNINTQTHLSTFEVFVFLQCWWCTVNTLKRDTKTATHQCFYWWCTEEYLTTRSEPTCFCHHQLLLFVMVTHSHSISMHTPNAYSLLQITRPYIIAFALGLLILHHRYEQQLFKETWQWFHPWVPQCAWTWLSETTHLYQMSHMGDTPDTWLHQWHQVWEGETRLNTVDIPRSAKGFLALFHIFLGKSGTKQ